MKHTSVYRVHCRTFKALLAILNIKLADDEGLATYGDSPVAHFRTLPRFRDARSMALRKMVADVVRAERKRRRLAR